METKSNIKIVNKKHDVNKKHVVNKITNSQS